MSREIIFDVSEKLTAGKVIHFADHPAPEARHKLAQRACPEFRRVSAGNRSKTFASAVEPALSLSKGATLFLISDIRYLISTLHLQPSTRSPQ
jgi:hypothetical protein